MCNVHVSVQNGLENTNYSRYFRQEGIYYRKLEAYRIMGRAMRAKVRETTTQVQEIRMYKHHKQLNRGSQLPQDWCVFESQKDIQKLTGKSHICIVNYAIAIVASPSLSPSKSLWQNQNQNPAIKGFWEMQCPCSQLLQHGRRLSKTGIGLRTKRQYPAGILYPYAETTLILFCSAPLSPGRQVFSFQAIDDRSLLTRGQRKKIRMLKCKVPQRNSPARWSYGKADIQKNKEFSSLKEPIIWAQVVAIVFKRSQIL